MKSVLCISVAVLVAGCGVSSDNPASEDVVQAAAVRAPGYFDEVEHARAIEEVHDWLVSQQVAAGLEHPIEIQLTLDDLASLDEDCDDCLKRHKNLRVGVAKDVTAWFDPSQPSHGAFGPDGVWTAAVRSDGAFGLRIHLEDVWLPKGTELYVYGADGSVAGPYTGAGPMDSGEFWTQTVGGPVAYLQLHADPTAEVGEVASFEITQVAHLDQALADALYKKRPPRSNLCRDNAHCVQNAACIDDPTVDDAREAVAYMEYVEGAYVYLCSGGLLNTTAGDFTPYFLTANHCIGSQTVASTLDTFFDHTTSCSSPVCGYGTTVNTSGATLLATSETSDFTLLELSGAPPAGSVFLGWTSAPVYDTHGADLYRISHPQGMPQAYSHHTVDTDPPVVCSGWPRGEWIYSHDVLGATEGGSSGSPVINASGQVVGQLSGGCGYNVNDDCDNENNSTVDGAFAAYYDDISSWLAGYDPCADDPDVDGDGYDAEACGGTDCDDTDFDVNPGATEICGDGIDNDCVGGDESCPCDDNDGDGYEAEWCGGDDCDDDDYFVNPGATEVCGDGIDNDCVGGDEICCYDNDGDGYDDDACGGTDCDDGDYDVNPGATEICGDGIDNDCVGGDAACCAAAGEYCDTGSDCCSGSCHPRKNYCR